MFPPFKTVAVIGKNHATAIPVMLEQVVGVLRRHGAAVLMDTRTAEAKTPIRLSPRLSARSSAWR